MGVTEGSSVMGLSEEEFNALSQEEKDEANKKTATVFFHCGADYVRVIGQKVLIDPSPNN